MSVITGFLNSPMTSSWLGKLLANDMIISAGVAEHDF
jgi:hypothetical protein